MTSRIVRRSVCGGLFALALLCGVAAEAQTPRKPVGGEPFRVAFSSTTSCMDPSEFVDEVLRRSKRLRPALNGEFGVNFVVELDDTRTGAQGHLRVVYPDGAMSDRLVPGASCHEVLSAMALIGVLMVEGDGTRPPALPPPPPPEPSDGPAPESPGASTPRSPSSWHFGLAHSLRFESGPLPAVALGQALTAEAAYAFGELWEPAIRVSGVRAMRSLEAPTDPSVGSALFHVTWVRVAACPVRLRVSSRFNVRPCAFGEVGHIYAEGYRTHAPATADLSLATAGAEVDLELSLAGPLVLRADAGARVMLNPSAGEEFYFRVSRPEFVVFTVPALGFSGGIGLGLRF